VSAPRRIAFWGNFGTRNLGNECTLAAVVTHARRRLPDARLSCICTEPDDAQRRHGIPCSPLGDIAWRLRGASGPGGLGKARRLVRELGAWWDALRTVRRIDLLVMTGTGMLTDEGEGPFGFAYDVFRWAVAARLCRAQVVFLSVGVEALGRPLSRFFVRTALRLASFRSYRDEQSRRHLRQAGFFSAGDLISPDLAFSLTGIPAVRVDRPEGVRPTVAIGLYPVRNRGAKGGADGEAYAAYLERVCALVGRLRERGHPLRLIIGDNAYDEPVLADVRAALEARGVHRRTVEDAPAQSYQELLEQLARVDLVVASRFHNVLLALLLGRPVVSLSYNEKNDALLEAMGLSEYGRRLDDFEVEWVLGRLGELEARGAALMREVEAKCAAFRGALDVQYDRVFGAEASLSGALIA